MNKLIFLAGMAVTGYLLFQFNGSEIETNEIFQAMTISDDAQEMPQVKAAGYHKLNHLTESYYQKNFERIRELEKFESELKGAILPEDGGNAQKIARFFLSLEKNQKLSTIVLIAENKDAEGMTAAIVSSDYGFESDFGSLEPDMDFIETMGIEVDNEAFSKENSISRFVPYIQKTFENVKVVPVLIKDSADAGELSALSQKLAEVSDDETIVLAMTAFGNKSDFRKELTRNVINSFDIKGIEQMDVDSRPVMKTLFQYLELKGAKRAANDYVIKFFEGEVADADRDLTVLAFGDMMLGRYVRTLMNQNGQDYIFKGVVGEDEMFLEGADIVHGNLEGPINGQGTSGGTSMVFSFNEDIAPLLKNYGFNLMSLANNHAVDQGWSGRDSTIAALEGSGVDWCGHPSEADPESVFYGKVGEKKFAFVCLHDVTFKLDDAAALELIRGIRPNVDYLLVSIHWGYEYKHVADQNVQISPARDFVDAGADFVIGHHPHVVQNFEIYKGRPIFYSLGNFVFDQYWSTETQEELALGIVLDDAGAEESFQAKIYLFPMKSERSQSRLMNENEKREWLEEFITYGTYSEEMQAMIRVGMIEVTGE